MAWSSGRPKLTQKEIEQQIFERTCVPHELITIVLRSFFEVAEEALIGNVEVPFGRLGWFSWKQINPRKNVTVWDFKNKCYKEGQNVDGFQKTVFRTGTAWSKKLKEMSTFALNEPNPMGATFVEEDEEEENDG